MSAKIFLSPEQKKRLQKALKNNTCPHFREHVLIYLLLNEGKTQNKISQFIGCSLRSVAYWSAHGDPDNLDSFRDKRENGNHQKATIEYIELLLKTIDTAPGEFGYEFGRWTTQRLSTHLCEKTKILLSSSQIRRILKKKQYSYILAKYSLEDKQNPVARKEFQEKMEHLLAITKSAPQHIQVWFWDESGFSLRTIRRKTWGKKGRRSGVPGQRRRGRVNIMGGLRFHDRKRHCFIIQRGNGESFLEQLEQLQEFVRKEWIEQGNKAEDFNTKGPLSVIVLDNASYHKRKDIIDSIKQNLPKIHLEFLPAYSPDYNLVELVWHSCKEYIAGRLFKSVEELEELLKSLLNDGKLIIKWGRNLKNKGNMINAT